MIGSQLSFYGGTYVPPDGGRSGRSPSTSVGQQEADNSAKMRSGPAFPSDAARRAMLTRQMSSLSRRSGNSRKSTSDPWENHSLYAEDGTSTPERKVGATIGADLDYFSAMPAHPGLPPDGGVTTGPWGSHANEGPEDAPKVGATIGNAFQDLSALAMPADMGSLPDGGVTTHYPRLDEGQEDSSGDATIRDNWERPSAMPAHWGQLPGEHREARAPQPPQPLDMASRLPLYPLRTPVASAKPPGQTDSAVALPAPMGQPTNPVAIHYAPVRQGGVRAFFRRIGAKLKGVKNRMRTGG